MLKTRTLLLIQITQCSVIFRLEAAEVGKRRRPRVVCVYSGEVMAGEQTTLRQE